MENFTERSTPAGLYSPQFEHDNCGIGAVVDIKGRKSHKTIDDALQIVEHLEHRAGKDAEGKTGDGVGILTQISDKFFQKAAAELGLEIGKEREYGIGMFFFPQDELKRNQAKKLFEIVCKKEGLSFLGWREVPTCPEVLGHKAIACMPSIWQGFVGKPQRVEAGIAFDRRLYVARRVFEQSSPDTYVCSLSSRTIVYKGMFLVKELRLFYPDLQDTDYESAIGMVHSRFSTNTAPSWNRAHPNRFILHNGEINTIRGNVDTMLAREETIGSNYLKDDMTKVLPIVNQGGSTPAAGSPFSKKHNSAGLHWLCAVVGNKAKITPFFPRSAFSAQQGCRPAALPAWGRRGPPAQRGRLPRACPSPSVCSWL